MDTESQSSLEDHFDMDIPLQDVHGNSVNKNDERDMSDSEEANNDKISNPATDLIYTIDQVPPWYLCIALGLQHYMVAFSGNVLLALLIANGLCMSGNNVAIGELIGTTFVASGAATVLQATLGCRLPIIQGTSMAFLIPSLSILAQEKWACPDMNQTATSNDTVDVYDDEVWMVRMRELQGALLMASVGQVLFGFSGVIGMSLSRIGPLTIIPTIALISFSSAGIVADLAAKHWWIAIMTIFLITVFSQILGNINVPIFFYSRKTGCSKRYFKIFRLAPVIIGFLVSWFICHILTLSNVLPSDSGSWGYEARTDLKTDALHKSAWFRIPYPGQWGVPTISISGVLGMMSGMIVSVVESVGDYHAAASISGAPPPPAHAINRGIGMEGIGCAISGILGAGNGLTSFSQNIGAIGITGVGSRAVVQAAGVIMIIMGCFAKFGAVVVSIPDPVIGGVMFIGIGLVGSVGLSNMKYIPMTSRNLFILGLPLLVGLAVPKWVGSHRETIETGNQTVNDIVINLLSNSIFVGGMLGFILDNAIKGTEEERGTKKWREVCSVQSEGYEGYDIPYIQRWLLKASWTRYVPFCPTHTSKHQHKDKPSYQNCQV